MYQQYIDVIEEHLRTRDEKLRSTQEHVKSLIQSLQDCHSDIDQLENDNLLLMEEIEVLQNRIAELEQRPEPLPCGLPDLTIAALEQVRKWDVALQKDNPRLDMGRQLKFAYKEIARLEEEVWSLRAGQIPMHEVWAGIFKYEERTPFVIWPWQQADRTLYDFLTNMRREALKQDHEDYDARRDEEDEGSEASN